MEIVSEHDRPGEKLDRFRAGTLCTLADSQGLLPVELIFRVRVFTLIQRVPVSQSCFLDPRSPVRCFDSRDAGLMPPSKLPLVRLLRRKIRTATMLCP